MSFRGPLRPQVTRYGLHACQVTYVTLYTRGSDGFVSSAVVSVATGWSEPVPGRELHPLKSSAFHGALFRQSTSGVRGIMASTTLTLKLHFLRSDVMIPAFRAAGLDPI